MITVLVVDDDFRVARIHSAFVDRVEGFRTVGVGQTGARGGRTGRADCVPDLILLDLYLPDVFGLDVLNQMRVAGVEGDVIVISAANESETVERALKLGVASYLLKPFTLGRSGHPAGRVPGAACGAVRGPGSATRRRWTGSSAGPGPPAEALPKGMSAETAELILDYAACRRGAVGSGVRRRGGHLPGQCSPIPGVLRAQGKAQVSLRYGSRGRPERRYTRVADES